MMKKVLVLISMTGLGFLLAWAFSADSSQRKAELQGVKARLEQLRAALEKTESERNDLKVKIAVEQLDCDKLQEQVNELTGSRDKLLQQTREFSFLREQSRQQLAEMIDKRDKLNKRIAGLTVANDELQQQLTELNTSQNQLRWLVDELTRSRDAAVAKARIAQERAEILLALVDAETKGFRELQQQDEIIVINQATNDTQPAIIDISENPDTLTDISWPPVIGAQVIERPICQSFSTARPQILPGQTSTLSWQVSNAEKIRIEPGIGTVGILGSRVVKPSRTTTYTLIATNKAGESRKTCRVEVGERPAVLTEVIEPPDVSSEVIEPPVSDPNAMPGKILGFRARRDESGKLVLIPIYESKQDQ